MLNLSQRRSKEAASKRVASLGIDVGSYSTKIVRYTPGGENPYACLELRTGVIGNLQPQENPQVTLQPAGSEMDLETEQQAPERRRSDTTLNISRWSQRQIDSLSSKIADAVGLIDRRELVQATLSMATCDLRSVQVANVQSPDVDTLRKQISELTQDRRPRSLAIVRSADKHNNVKVVSVPEELVDGLAISLDACGITPNSVEATPWTMAKSIRSNDPVIVLDLGYSEPTLIAKNSAGVQYIRRMRRGGFAKILAPTMERYGLTEQQATRLFLESMDPDRPSSIDPELRKDAGMGFKETVRETCKSLCGEIEAALEFISWKFDGFSKDTLLLQGGMAEHDCVLEQLRQKVRSELRVVEGDKNSNITARYSKAAALAGWRFQL